MRSSAPAQWTARLWRGFVPQTRHMAALGPQPGFSGADDDWTSGGTDALYGIGVAAPFRMRVDACGFRAPRVAHTCDLGERTQHHARREAGGRAGRAEAGDGHRDGSRRRSGRSGRHTGGAATGAHGLSRVAIAGAPRPTDQRGGSSARQAVALSQRQVHARHPALPGCRNQTVRNPRLQGEER